MGFSCLCMVLTAFTAPCFPIRPCTFRSKGPIGPHHVAKYFNPGETVNLFLPKKDRCPPPPPHFHLPPHPKFKFNSETNCLFNNPGYCIFFVTCKMGYCDAMCKMHALLSPLTPPVIGLEMTRDEGGREGRQKPLIMASNPVSFAHGPRCTKTLTLNFSQRLLSTESLNLVWW